MPIPRWRLRGGVNLDFDDGVFLEAGESLIVISFNPDNPGNALRLAAFRAHYEIDGSVKIQGHAVRYPPCDDSVVAQVYGMLLDDAHVNSRLLGQVMDACPSLEDKVNLLTALLLQPPTDQRREWIDAFGLAWRSTDILYMSESTRVPVVTTAKRRRVAANDTAYLMAT